MDFVINSCIADLTVIGMLRERSKLIIRHGSLNVSHEHDLWYNKIGNSINRLYHKDSRNSSIMYIENLILRSCDISRSLENFEMMNNRTKDQMKAQFKQAHLHAIQGLQHLKNTYNEDSATVAKIVILINMIDNEVK